MSDPVGALLISVGAIVTFLALIAGTTIYFLVCKFPQIKTGVNISCLVLFMAPAIMEFYSIHAEVAQSENKIVEFNEIERGVFYSEIELLNALYKECRALEAQQRQLYHPPPKGGGHISSA